MILADFVSGENGPLTTGADEAEGGAGADTVRAAFVNNGAGVDNGTLQASDIINLAGGVDTAEVRVGEAMTAALAPEFVGVENVEITITAVGATIDGFQTIFSDAAELTLASGVQDFDIDDINFSTTEVVIEDEDNAVVLGGTGATASVSAGGIETGLVTVNDATRLNLTLTDDLTTDFGNGALATLVVDGVGVLTVVDANDEGFTSISASNLDGSVDLTDVAVTTDVTGSDGNDVIRYTGTLVAGTAVDGGAGADTLEIDTAITASTGVENIETLVITGNNTAYYGDAATAISVDTIVHAHDDNGRAYILTDAQLSGISYQISDRNASAAGNALSVTYDADAATGTSDVLEIDVVTTISSATALTITNLGIDDVDGEVESVIINLSGTRAVIISDLDDGGNGEIDATSITFSGGVDLTLSDIDLASGEDVRLDFSAVSGDVSLTADMSDIEADDTVIGGSGSDDVFIMNLGANTVAATISAFETIAITDANAGTLALADTAGLEFLEIDAITTGVLTVTGASSGLTVIALAAGTENMSIDTASAGGTINLDLSEADFGLAGDSVTFGTHVSTINVEVSDDSVDNAVVNIASQAASSVTVNISGDDAVTLTTDFAGTATSVTIVSEAAITHDVSGETFDDDVILSYAGSSGAISVTVASADLSLGDTTFIGGDGDEDTLSVDLGATTNAASVSGFETIEVTDSNAGTLDVSGFDGATLFTLDAEAGGLSVTNGTAALEITMSASAGQDAVTIDGADNTATGNVLTLNLVAANGAAADDVTVTDYEQIVVVVSANQTALDLTAVTDDADTITLEGTGNVVMAAGAALTGAEVIDLSALAGDFDSTAAVVFAADADFILGSDNADVTLDLAAGAEQTITFGASLDLGEVVTINGFLDGGAVNHDILDLSSLGVTGVADLIFTDNAGDLEITSGDFDGMIVLVGVVTADIVAANFVFA